MEAARSAKWRAGSVPMALALLALAGCDAERTPAAARGSTRATAEGVLLPAPGAAAERERVLVDVRAPADFAAGHAAGALNLQLGWQQLEARAAAYLPDRGAPVAVAGKSAAEVRAAMGVLERLGYRDVLPAELAPAGARLSLMRAAELERRLAGAAPPVVIDVRTRAEQARGAIDGALLLDEDAAPARLAELDPEREYAVICELGWRSSQLASLMRRRGFERVHNVIDGMAGWRAR